MKVGIIGSGFLGLSAGYRLTQQGVSVTILEKDSSPGGLANGYKEKDWDWTLEKHYHHWFSNDDYVLNLAKDLDYKVVFTKSKTSIFINNSRYELDSPTALIKFPLLPMIQKIRMGVILAFLRFNPYWKPLEKINATKFLPKFMGKNAYKLIWEPQLVNKMGEYANAVSLVWFWTRIHKRTATLAYPEKGYLQFANKIAEKIQENKGEILYDHELIEITSNNNSVNVKTKDSNGKTKTYIFDKLIVSLPTFLFSKVAPQLSDDYKTRYTGLKGLGASNMVLRLKEEFMKDKTYWLSICENPSPVMVVVEHTNLMNKKHYNNEHIVYVGNYLKADSETYKMDDKELLKLYDPILKKINPDYKKILIDYKVFKTPFAQPIVPVNYSNMIPPFETPLKNVYLANMQQVYPWDRGTNYAVGLGEKVAKLVIQGR